MNPWRRTFLKALAILPLTWLGGWGLRRARSRQRPLLRPPGAGREDVFLSTCIRCQQCVVACPRQCLVPDDGSGGWSSLATPRVAARQNACDLCSGRADLECIAVCPTAALQPVASRSEVRMGLAIVDPHTCLPFLGVSCNACWHACPFPGAAIRLDDRGRPLVLTEGCVGCGLCEYACLAEEPAIVVRP